MFRKERTAARGRRTALRAGVVASVLLAFGCSANGPGMQPDAAQTTASAGPGAAVALPGSAWKRIRAVALPAGGEATYVSGRGHLRVFGWRRAGAAADNAVGAVDLTTGRVAILKGVTPGALTSGNWTDGTTIVRSEVLQGAAADSPITWKLYAQTGIDGQPQVLDSSSTAGDLNTQPLVAMTGAGIAWSKGSPACGCFQLLLRRPGAHANEVLYRDTAPFIVKTDGERVLVLGRTVRVIDPAISRDVPVPVSGTATGAIFGAQVMLYQPTDPTTGAGQLLATTVSPTAATVRPSRQDAPVGLAQVDFLDRTHLILIDGDATVRLLDLRTGRLTPAPAPAELSARYALDVGTYTTVTGEPGHETLAEWHLSST